MAFLASLTAVSSCSPAANTREGAPVTLVVPPLVDVADGGAVARPDDVRFGRVSPGVGTHWSVEVDARSELEVIASSRGSGGGSELQVSEYLSQFRVDVLAMDAQAPTKLRVEFGKNLQRYQGSDLPSVVAGRAYVVDDHPPYVRADNGAPVTPEEIQRVLDVVPDLGARPGVEQALPGSPMTIGQPRPEIATAILRLVHPRAWTLERGSAVLARADSDEAVFHVTIEATSPSNLRMHVAGDAHVRRRDAWLSAVELDGTFQSAEAGAQPGTFRYRRVVRE